MRFDGVPENRRFIFPHPGDIRECYANSIRLSDMGLEEFMIQLNKRGYLRNSLIIISGDHGFPLEEHGISHNEVGFYEEIFRTPFLLLWKGKIKPRRIADHPYSQMDIAPSILDILGLSEVKNHFQGVSFFQEKTSSQPIYLVQPYGGKYLGVVMQPYKYVKHMRTGREYVFNLENDPQEKVNLFSQLDAPLKRKLRKGLHDIFYHQKLIEMDRIWPR